MTPNNYTIEEMKLIFRMSLSVFEALLSLDINFQGGLSLILTLYYEESVWRQIHLQLT